MSQAAPRPSFAARWWRPVVLAALWAAPLPLLRIAVLREAVVGAAEWMRAGGAGAIAIYFTVYALGGLLALPTLLMSSIAGFAYGPVLGVAIASPACAVAATFVCVVSRRVGFATPRAAAERVATSPRFAALLRMLSSADLKTAILLRATPLVPQNLLAYAFSFSRLSASRVFVATLVGLFPMTCVHVYVGSLVAHAAELLESGGHLPGPIWMPYALGGVSIFTILASILVLRAGARGRRRDGD